MVISIHLL